MLGAAAAALGALVVVPSVLDGVPAPAVVAVPAVFAALCWIARLGLWAALWRTPVPVPADPQRRDAADAALATTEVAVVCDGDTMVAARTATIAAIASVGDAERVLLVGSDPRLEGLASSLSVRHVASGIGERASIDAAVAAATGSHLVLTPASAALLPGALRPALERFHEPTGDPQGTASGTASEAATGAPSTPASDAPSETGAAPVAWVQAEQHAPADRTLIDHVRVAHWWPSMDAHGATPWLGLGSVVHLESFRALPVSEGAAAVTLAAQRQGWSGRWIPSMLAVEQSDGRRDPRAEVEARAQRFRSTITRSSPILDGRLTTGQRLGHAALLAEDLVGVAAGCAVVSVIGALLTGTVPVPLASLPWLLVAAVVLSWAARLVLSRGLVRPLALARAATDDLGVAWRAVLAAVRPARPGRVPRPHGTRPTGWRAQVGLLALVALVDAALLSHAWKVLRSDASLSRQDVALFAAAAITVATLLSSARVLRRRRTLRGARRLPVEVAATIGPWQGRVLDLSASGLRAEFGAPASLLDEVPVRLHARGVRPVEVQAQVVRVDERASTWVLGLRLTGGAASGAHDEYLALWLTQMAGAAEERPKRVDDPVLGRRRVHAAGAPVVRVLTAAAMLLVGVAVLPVGGGASADDGSDHHASEVSTAPDADVDAHEHTDDGTDTEEHTGDGNDTGNDTGDVGLSVGDVLPVLDRIPAGDTVDDADVPATTLGPDQESGDGSEEGPGVPEPVDVPDARPSATTGELTVTASVDDVDRVVEGGQLVTHTVELTGTGAAAVELADVVATPGAGAIDPTSLGGTCAGADAGAIDPTSDTVRWRLFEASPLEPGTTCTVTWRVTLPAATDLDDGARLTTEIDVADVRVGGTDGQPVPTLVDEIVVHRPTLRLSLTAGDRTTLDHMTIGTPFTWVLAVENISPQPAVAHGIDLVQTLPKNWTYTSTVSVTPSTCDVAPVVLVDDVAATQAITWSDTCDLATGERLEIVITATAQEAAGTDPGVVDAAGERIAHVSDVTLTAEDAAGNTLGSATDRAGAVPRTVGLLVRLTDTGEDDATAELGPAAMVGSLARYRVDVANGGPDATTSPIAVTLELPPGFVPIGADGDAWSCDLAAPVVCNRPGTIVPDDAAPPLVVTVAVAADALLDDGADGDATRAVVNARVTVSGGGLDIDDSDDVDDETTVVSAVPDGSGPPFADLTVTAITGKQVLAVGEAMSYEVLVTNQGPTADPGPVVVRAVVPVGLAVDGAQGDGWTCVVEPAGDLDGGGWSCETPGPIEVGTLLPPIRVSGTSTGAEAENLAPSADRAVVQTVSVEGSTPASDDAVDAEVSWQTVPEASLGLVVRQAFLDDEEAAADAAATADDGWRVGTSGVVKLVVVNEGPSGEYGPIDVVVPTPDGAQIVDAGGSGWACRRSAATSDTGEQWSCRLDRSSVGYGEALVEAGGSAPPLGVSVVFVHDGAAEFTATVIGVTDPVVHGGRASFEVGRRVTGSIDLLAPDEVRAGEQVWVDLVVANGGPSDGREPVEVHVALPEGWTAVAVDHADWACAAEDVPTSIRCVRERPMLARETATLGVRVSVPAAAESGDVDLATVLAADVDEQDPSDDTDDAEVFVWGAGTTERPVETTTTTIDPHAPVDPAAPIEAGDLAGYGGAAGALAFAVLLVSGRRRPGW